MGTTRFTDGSVTVTLDGGLEDFVRRALDAAAGETVRIMEAAAGEVAASAESKWYTEVKRRTGRTGDVQVVTTVSADQVRVSVGSTDLKNAIYVHRPGRFSTVPVEIDAADYSAAKRKGGAAGSMVFHARVTNKAQGVEAGRYYRREANPAASDGKYLVPELIRAPMKLKIREITPALGQAVAKRSGG